jgi:hypothetical protein
MYVVGEEILVEPFEVEKPSSKLISLKKGADVGKISYAGKVISVGTGPMVQEQINKGALVQIDPDIGSPMMIGGRILFKIPLRAVAICYEDMTEYRKAVVSEEAMLKEQEERELMMRLGNTADNGLPNGALAEKH